MRLVDGGVDEFMFCEIIKQVGNPRIFSEQISSPYVTQGSATERLAADS